MLIRFCYWAVRNLIYTLMASVFVVNFSVLLRLRSDLVTLGFWTKIFCPFLILSIVPIFWLVFINSALLICPYLLKSTHY